MNEARAAIVLRAWFDVHGEHDGHAAAAAFHDGLAARGFAPGPIVIAKALGRPIVGCDILPGEEVYQDSLEVIEALLDEHGDFLGSFGRGARIWITVRFYRQWAELAFGRGLVAKCAAAGIGLSCENRTG